MSLANSFANAFSFYLFKSILMTGISSIRYVIHELVTQFNLQGREGQNSLPVS